MPLPGPMASCACGGSSWMWMARFAAGTAELDVRLCFNEHLACLSDQLAGSCIWPQTTPVCFFCGFLERPRLPLLCAFLKGPSVLLLKIPTQFFSGLAQLHKRTIVSDLLVVICGIRSLGVVAGMIGISVANTMCSHHDGCLPTQIPMRL